jgi:hypothetical protein
MYDLSNRSSRRLLRVQRAAVLRSPCAKRRSSTTKYARSRGLPATNGEAKHETHDDGMRTFLPPTWIKQQLSNVLDLFCQHLSAHFVSELYEHLSASFVLIPGQPGLLFILCSIYPTFRPFATPVVIRFLVSLLEGTAPSIWPTCFNTPLIPPSLVFGFGSFGLCEHLSHYCLYELRLDIYINVI